MFVGRHVATDRCLAIEQKFSNDERQRKHGLALALFKVKERGIWKMSLVLLLS